ncbi:MAG: DinB family protein [Acidimicrobiales bacterium]
MALPPDTKDWTWVLERPCVECGFNATDHPPATFSRVIRDNAVQWTGVLQRDNVHLRTREDRWSALEYACHVRDVYRLFDERLRLMLEEDGPVFQNWDQDVTAFEERYDLQDPAIVSGELLDAAALYADRFDTVTPLAWDRPGTRSNGSLFTVRSLGTYGLHDPFHHLWDVSRS